MRNSATRSSRFLASSETWDLDIPSIPMDCTRSSTLPGRDALDVGLADHPDERLLGPPARLEERRQVAALAELGDIEVDRAGPGVPAPLPVPVAAVHPVLGPLAVAGVAEHVDIGVHQQLGCHLHHLAKQVAPHRASRYLRTSSAAPIVLVTFTASSPSVLWTEFEDWCGGRRVWGILRSGYPSYTTLADSTPAGPLPSAAPAGPPSCPSDLDTGVPAGVPIPGAFRRTGPTGGDRHSPPDTSDLPLLIGRVRGRSGRPA